MYIKKKYLINNKSDIVIIETRYINIHFQLYF
jgi:hypothetical protein